ncbi:MAG: efflux RND transporter periplasmic adaptor subunit [Myxococcota bacterium]
MKLDPKVTLPLGVLLFGLLGALSIVAIRPSVATRKPEPVIPLVPVITARSQSVQLRIEARGSVVPRTESELVAEVAGRITWVSPALAPGGFLAAGEPLLRIDPIDYELGLERARAALERAESELALARASLARKRTLADHGVTSLAVLDEASSRQRVAAAARREAQAAVTQARRDLERTEVVASFDGRVREKRVDVGQFVGRGAAVAKIYAVDYAEVRLPLPDGEAAFVDLPTRYRGTDDDSDGPAVRLSARFAGREYSWSGRIVRTEAELDPRTRMIHAVARVEDPYGRGEDPNRPPLEVGLFVNAEIEGRLVEGVIELPRAALRGGDQVVIVDDEERLRLRPVQVLRRERETVLIRSGIEPGERVCVMPLAVTVEGMMVKALERPALAGDDRRALRRAS